MGSSLAEADGVIAKQMIIDLLKLFDVEKPHEEIAAKLFDGYQEFLIPRSDKGLMRFFQHFELWADYMGGSAYCGLQMERLGLQVLNLLNHLDIKNRLIKPEMIQSAIRFWNG
jgi:hypothetical protein